jgi:hypothetical protein
MCTKYTLKSNINGKYVSSLFSDTHKGRFQAVGHDDAYVWANMDNAHKMKDEIGNCSVVVIVVTEKKGV